MQTADMKMDKTAGEIQAGPNKNRTVKQKEQKGTHKMIRCFVVFVSTSRRDKISAR